MQKDTIMVVGSFLLAFALLGSFWFITQWGAPVLAPLLDTKYEPPHDHDEGDHHHKSHDAHDHSALLDIDANPPTLALKLEKDTKSGFNLFVETQNFTFAPKQAGADHVVGQGHAHLYVDGKKIARLYAAAYHIDMDLEKYQELQVTLNANSHETLAINGEAVEVTIPLDEYFTLEDSSHCHEFHCHKDHS